MSTPINKKFNLLALEIEGFQSIRDPIRIEFAPITLLYGPNSAGKSAIFDALKLLMLIWDPYKQATTDELEDILCKWVHIPINHNASKIDKVLTLVVEVLVPEDLSNLDLGPDDHSGFYNEDIAYEALGKKLKFSFKANSYFGVDRFDIESFSIFNCTENVEVLNVASQTRDRQYEFKINGNVQKGLSNDLLFYGCNIFTNLGSPIGTGGDYPDYMNFYGNLLERLLYQSTSLVHADRSIPAPEDSVFFIDEHVNSAIRKVVYKKFGFDNMFFIKLSSLAVHNEIYSDFITTFTDGIKHVDKHLDQRKLNQFRRVNEYLSNYLFHEKGYQISADINYLVQFVEFVDGDPRRIKNTPAFVHLFLVDNESRKIEIQDVGSGIAFVIPVLVSVSINQISSIQQPELHLHPALQSSLADVFIDRLNDLDENWQTIVETHSEHLLLRLLRRVRETGMGKRKDNKVSPDDIGIYYFNPLVTGTTAVQKLRISSDGEFIDRWPRGFFTERDGDLFDE